MATRRKDEVVRIGSDTKDAEKGLKRFGGLAKAVLAALVAVAGAALVRLGAAMVGVFRVQEQAEAKLRRSLVSSGQYTAEYERRLLDLSSHIQEISIVGDEAAQGVIQHLVQVGQVAQTQIEAATLATIGMARQQGRSLERTSRTVASSLADIADENKASLGELERFFTSTEREKLKALKKTEGGAAAQAEAIRILDERYREHAKAIDGSTDVYVQLANAWGDVNEEFGRFIHMFTGPIAALVLPWVNSLKVGLSEVYAEVNVLSAHWDVFLAQTKHLFGGGDAAGLDAALKKLEEARQRVRVEMVAGGASTAGAAIDTSGTPDGAEKDQSAEVARAAEQTRQAKQRVDLARATLLGMSDAELEFKKTQIKIANERAAALKLTDKEITRAHGEALLEALALEERIAGDKLRAANLAAFAAMQAEFGPDALERRKEAAIFAREAERELGRALDQGDLEYLREHLETEATIRRQYRDEELAEILRAREEQIAYEEEFGETAARIREWTHSDGIQSAREFMDGLASVQQTGNKKLDRLIRASTRAKLLLDAATKPFEAYAATSSKYPWPLGPTLGALHAAAVAAKIGVALRAVGGGGGGAAGRRGRRRRRPPRCRSLPSAQGRRFISRSISTARRSRRSCADTSPLQRTSDGYVAVGVGGRRGRADRAVSFAIAPDPAERADHRQDGRGRRHRGAVPRPDMDDGPGGRPSLSRRDHAIARAGRRRSGCQHLGA